MDNSNKSLLQNPNTIQPLSPKETEEFINFHKNHFLTSLKSTQENFDEIEKKVNETVYEHNTLDSDCMRELNKRLVRIEYPAEVHDHKKAISTLGGMDNIELSVAEHKTKLKLHFHPENRYNKPCIADKDFNPGILIKVKKKRRTDPEIGQDLPEFDYQVMGMTVLNYTFNRVCDFQYLPLIAKGLENKSSNCDYIYNNILPEKLPDLQWLLSEESKQMPKFLVPAHFSHFDNPSTKFNELFETTESNKPNQASKQKKIYSKPKHTTVFMNFNDKNIPQKPLETTLKLLENRDLDDKLERVKRLFEQRPIWTKSAVRFNTRITFDQSKILLPIVAYYFYNGPWRVSWVKFGYDPRQDPKARIYQTLDYRIRAAESSKLKVNAKRSYTSKSTLYFQPNSVKKVSLKDDISVKPKRQLDEKCYVLRPFTIPPARQMFYQFCDLMLPEIQNMLSQLPNTPTDSVCDVKNGWFPKHFVEQSRDIVNNYVLQAVQKEILEDSKLIQEKASKEQQTKVNTNTSDYCNEMLSNIKKGIYKEVNIKLAGPSCSKQLTDISDEIELISLSSDDDEDTYTVGEIIQNTIPEKMDEFEESDEEHLSEILDNADIDMEAVEEINQMIANMNKNAN